MKEFFKGILFISIFLGYIVGGSALVNFLASIITMEMIMTVVYIFLGISLVYLFTHWGEI